MALYQRVGIKRGTGMADRNGGMGIKRGMAEAEWG